jgi:hypothetical protein
MSLEMNDNDPEGNTKASKLGRKGDPRMHQAVVARLSNPDISLYEALRMGGFEYPTNDDASIVDSQRVTLGQRKNQLSRRLRLARKNLDDADNPPTSGNHESSLIGDGGDRGDTPSIEEENIRSTSTETPFYTREKQHRENSGNGPGNSVSSVAASGATSVPERRSAMYSGNTRHSSGNNKLGARALAMKREVDFCLVDEDCGDGEAPSRQDSPPKRQCMAKFHPDFAPILVHPVRFSDKTSYHENGGGNIAMNVTGTMSGATNGQQTLQHHLGTDSGLGWNGAVAPAVTPMTSLGGPSPFLMMGSSMQGTSGLSPNQYYDPQYSSFFPGQQSSIHIPPPPRASAVAVSSLVSSAQAVGLTLEQLALTLSSNTRNLAKLVADTRSGESMTKQQELALNLHEVETKALYTKCMIVAGIDVSLAQPGTPTYTAFALKACQAEGQRLQGIVRTARRDRANSDLSVDETEARPSKSVGCEGDDDEIESHHRSSVGQHQSHDRIDDDHHHHHLHHHSGGADSETDEHHDVEKCEARHIHRLSQCGHKAIIHHPKDGAAHIDFIVKDQIECYMGIDSLPLGRGVDSAWPSKYKCKDGGDECSAKTCGKKSLPPNASDNWGSAESIGTEPKIFKLSEINVQDPEWNFDPTGSVDGGVMGLFQLGGDGAS